MSDKRQLRKDLKKILTNISIEDKRSKSSRLSGMLVDVLSEYFSNVNFILGVYAPLKSEVDWSLSFSNEFCKKLAYPKLPENEQHLMYFAHCLKEDLVESNEFGSKILVPPHDADKIVPSALLIPGLAFTKQGCRLGRGGGFYDRYLEKYQGIKIGICFNEQLLNEIPVDPHDCLMDLVVTDKELFYINKNLRSNDK